MIARRNLLQLFALVPMVGGAAIIEACAKPVPKPGKFYYEATRPRLSQVNDPGHTHSISDPQHYHSIIATPEVSK